MNTCTYGACGRGVCVCVCVSVCPHDNLKTIADRYLQSVALSKLTLGSQFFRSSLSIASSAW